MMRRNWGENNEGWGRDIEIREKRKKGWHQIHVSQVLNKHQFSSLKNPSSSWETTHFTTTKLAPPHPSSYIIQYYLYILLIHAPFL